MKNLFQVESYRQFNQMKSNELLLQPSEFSIRFILDFARAYQVRKIADNRFLEFVLN